MLKRNQGIGLLPFVRASISCSLFKIVLLIQTHFWCHRFICMMNISGKDKTQNSGFLTNHDQTAVFNVETPFSAYERRFFLVQTNPPIHFDESIRKSNFSGITTQRYFSPKGCKIPPWIEKPFWNESATCSP